MATKRWVILPSQAKSNQVSAEPAPEKSPNLRERLLPLLRMLQKEAKFLASQIYFSSDNKNVVIAKETAELMLGGLVSIIDELEKLSKE